ncbi:MAG: hypothetical protein R3E83_22815 [Burkholderiaceae bacterium]
MCIRAGGNRPGRLFGACCRCVGSQRRARRGFGDARIPRICSLRRPFRALVSGKRLHYPRRQAGNRLIDDSAGLEDARGGGIRRYVVRSLDPDPAALVDSDTRHPVSAERIRTVAFTQTDIGLATRRYARHRHASGGTCLGQGRALARAHRRAALAQGLIERVVQPGSDWRERPRRQAWLPGDDDDRAKQNQQKERKPGKDTIHQNRL